MSWQARQLVDALGTSALAFGRGASKSGVVRSTYSVAWWSLENLFDEEKEPGERLAVEA
jgi:hypothetical protein